jgi:hypothetical protein
MRTGPECREIRSDGVDVTGILGGMDDVAINHIRKTAEGGGLSGYNVVRSDLTIPQIYPLLEWARGSMALAS